MTIGKNQYFMKVALRLLLLLLSVTISLYALSFLDFQVKGILYAKLEGIWRQSWYRLAFYTHVTFGGLALLVGPTQFWRRIRQRYLRVHRTAGKVYVVACLLAGGAGLTLAFFAEAGIVARLGFGGLAFSWLYTTVQAYLAIRRRNLPAHEAWMYRSFALTFAAVTLRLWLPLFTFGFGWPFEVSYRIIAWLCWTPNLLIAEWLIRRYRKSGLLRAVVAR